MSARAVDDLHPQQFRQSRNDAPIPSKVSKEEQQIFLESTIADRAIDCYPALAREIENHGSESVRTALHHVEHQRPAASGKHYTCESCGHVGNL